MSERRTLFSDNFDRVTPTHPAAPVAPNNTYTTIGDAYLGPDWEYDFSHDWGARDWAILSGGVRSWYGAAWDEARCVNAAALAIPANQWVEIKYVAAPNEVTSNKGIGLHFRMDTAGHCYDLFYYANGDWYIGRDLLSATYASGTGTALAQNDVLRVEIQGQDISVYLNDVLVTTYTEGTNRYTSGGVGFGFNGQFEDSAPNNPMAVVDNFACGDWTEAEAEEPQIFITT